MEIKKTLEEIIDEVPPVVFSAGSAAAALPISYVVVNGLTTTPSPSYYAYYGPLSLSAAAALWAFYYFRERKALRKLNINQDNIKNLSEKLTEDEIKEPVTMVHRIANFFPRHPKIGGVVAGAAYTFYNAVSDWGGLTVLGGYPFTGWLDYALLALRDTAAHLLNATFLGYLAYFGMKHAAPMFSPSSSVRALEFLFTYSLLGRKATLKLLKAKKQPSQNLYLNIAALQVKESEIDEACESLVKASTAPTKSFIKYFNSTYYVSSELASSYYKFIKNNADITSAVTLSLLCDTLGHKDTADKILSEMAASANTAEANAVAAFWLQNALKRENHTGAYWSRTLELLISDPNSTVLPASDGLHRVYRLGSGKFMQKTTIFKEGLSEEAKAERQLTEYISKIPKEPRYNVPRVLAILPLDPATTLNGKTKSILVMQYIPGKTLLEIAEEAQPSFEDLAPVIDYATILHKNVPLIPSFGKADLKAKLKALVENQEFLLHPELKERIKRNFERIAEDISGYDVIALDMHPGNWHFSDSAVTKLDNSPGVDSLFKDSAKLFVHPALVLSTDLIDRLQHESYARYRYFGMISMDETTFRRLHLEGMLFQSMSFASAWSVREMLHMSQRRAEAIMNASTIFDMIRQNHRQHYFHNRIDYDNLESDFKSTEEILLS